MKLGIAAERVIAFAERRAHCPNLTALCGRE